MGNAALSIKISGDGSQAVVNSLNSIAKSTSNLQKSMAQASMIGNLVANGITKIVSSGKAYIQSSIDIADATAKGARNAGFAGDEFQRLQFAADRSSTSFEMVRGAIARLQIEVGKGNKGFQTLGINISELKKMSPEQQFATVAKSLGEVKNQGERAAITTQVFGRAAMKDIGEVITNYDALATEFKGLGGTISDPALVAAEQWKDMLTNIQTKFRATVLNLLPSIKLFAQVWWAEIKTIAATVVGVVTGISSVIGGLYESIVSRVSWIFENFRDIAYNIGQTFTSAFVDSFEVLKRLVISTKNWITGQGWDFTVQGLFQGGDWRSIEMPASFDQALSDAFSNSFNNLVAIQDQRQAELNQIQASYDELMSTKIEAARNEAGTTQNKRQEAKFAQAAIVGSAEAYRAINMARYGQSNSIEKQQLDTLRDMNRNIGRLVEVTNTSRITEEEDF